MNKVATFLLGFIVCALLFVPFQAGAQDGDDPVPPFTAQRWEDDWAEGYTCWDAPYEPWAPDLQIYQQGQDGIVTRVLNCWLDARWKIKPRDNDAPPLPQVPL